MSVLTILHVENIILLLYFMMQGSKYRCDRDIFDHKSETMLKYISITVIFYRYFKPCDDRVFT